MGIIDHIIAFLIGMLIGYTIIKAIDAYFKAKMRWLCVTYTFVKNNDKSMLVTFGYKYFKVHGSIALTTDNITRIIQEENNTTDEVKILAISVLNADEYKEQES